MKSKNDIKILELQKQIEDKKKQLKTSGSFVALTNCLLELAGTRVNIRTLKKQELITLLVKLNMELMSAKALNLENEYLLNGYLLEDWLTDLKGRLVELTKKEEETKLKQLETKLNKLLSEDTRIELELEQIAESLLS